MNIDQAHNLSRSFLLASERCAETRQMPNGQLQSPLVPAIVCAAFSIEIGFKAIILSEGSTVSGHKLTKLFRKIHKLTKLFRKISPVTQDLIVQEVGLDCAAFTAALDLVSNAFVDWRYFYERDITREVDFNFLTKLANATQRTAASVR